MLSERLWHPNWSRVELLCVAQAQRDLEELYYLLDNEELSSDDRARTTKRILEIRETISN